MRRSLFGTVGALARLAISLVSFCFNSRVRDSHLCGEGRPRSHKSDRRIRLSVPLAEHFLHTLVSSIQSARRRRSVYSFEFAQIKFTKKEGNKP